MASRCNAGLLLADPIDPASFVVGGEPQNEPQERTVP
jgi:hypothetical protein